MIVAKALDEEIRVFVSTEILKELEKILVRDFKEPEEYVRRQINLILEYAEIVRASIKLDIVKEDPADNKIIECALAVKADYIVTGDNHLLKLREFKGVKILTPAEFLNAISA